MYLIHFKPTLDDGVGLNKNSPRPLSGQNDVSPFSPVDARTATDVRILVEHLKKTRFYWLNKVYVGILLIQKLLSII